MTRRFRRRRAAESRPLALGIAVASFVALAGVVTFDLSGGTSNPAVQAAALSIDPGALGRGGEPASGEASAPGAARPVRAGLLLPGELLLDAAVESPRGSLLLNGAPVGYPSVLDSVPAGSHALRLMDGEQVVWESDVTLAPGGVERIVVPAVPEAPRTTAAADSARTPVDADSAGLPGSTI